MIARLRAVLQRLQGFFNKRSSEVELTEEFESNLQLHIDDEIRSGRSPEDARRKALIRFGSVDAAKEAWRDRRGIQWLEGIVWDIKYALRMLGRNRGGTAIALLSLTLCIGANTAVFSIADAVLFRPLPYADPDRVFTIAMMNKETGSRFAMVENRYIQTINEHHSGLGEVGLLEPGRSIVVASAGGAESVQTVAVTPNYLKVLGIRPARGRLFEASDAMSSGRPAVLTYGAWRDRFAGADSVIGKSLTFGTATLDIIGVLPPDFVFPAIVPTSFRGEVMTLMPPVQPGARGGVLMPVVRLEPNVTRPQAQAEMDVLVSSLTPADAKPITSLPVLDDLRSSLFRDRPIMTFLLASAGFVLLIGCANLTNILLARTKRRERETGLRAALGAGRARLVRPVIIEAVLLGIGGAILALAGTTLMFQILLRQVPPSVYRTARVGVDYRVALFTLSLGVLGGLIFSVFPSWRMVRVDLDSLIRGRLKASRRFLGAPMIIVQVAFSVVLAFGAVLSGKTLLGVLNVPLGFSPDNVIWISMTVPGADGMAKQDFLRRAIEKLSARPDVLAAGAVFTLPMDGAMPVSRAFLPGNPERRAGLTHALPGFWEAAGIRLVRGRLMTWNDVNSESNVAVINETAAKTLFPGQDPLGATVEMLPTNSLTIIGVVGDARNSVDGNFEPLVYAIPGSRTRVMSILVHVRSNQESTLAEIRSDVAGLAPGTPVTAGWWEASMQRLISYQTPRFQMMVLGGFGLLALSLTALGIFAIVNFLVVIRTREMGIRLAMGAAPASMVRLMAKQAMIPVGIGILAGLLAIRGLSRIAETQLYKVKAADSFTVILAIFIVTVAALFAVYLPARQAARVDPLVTLRME